MKTKNAIKKYYSLATNNGDRTADLYIFGNIVDAWNTGLDEAWDMDLGEVSGLSIAKDLKELDVDQINVHINSCGGYTSEGLTIYNVLKNCKAKVVTYCDGFACSAASLVFMAGDERIMGSASALMIHNAWADKEGNAAQLRQFADVLDQISNAAGNAYASRVNISREELDGLLDGVNHEGTWVLPEDAVKMGFATSVAEEETSGIANQSVMKQILSRITGTPAAVLENTEVDYEKVSDLVVSKLEKKINSLMANGSLQQKPPASEKKTVSTFLSALTKR